MKQVVSSVLFLIVLTGVAWCADAPASSSDIKWIDITEKVYAGASDSPGWEQDSKGQIFKDETQMFLKIVTAQFGTFKVDLKNQKIFELKADGGQTELAETSILQRDHGMTFVMKTPKVKIRGMIKEKVEGMKGISGIKGVM